MSKIKNKLVAVEWLDATGKVNLNKEFVDNAVDGKELLAHKITYGKIIKETKDALVILHEETIGDEDYDEVTVIPRPWIKSIK